MYIPISMEIYSKISPDDLLGRNTEHLYSSQASELIFNKVILVTGAGGSIGSEIVRQVTGLGAKRVYCVDQDEFALYQLQLNTVGSALLTDSNLILADIRNREVMDQIFSDVKPDIVFHAAANKHLPLLERSPASAITTNVLGTSNIANVCLKHNVKVFINISTDKAARPSSVLGFTKRLAEYCVSNIVGKSEMRVASVRFGNVLGSRGSFLPTLAWQIEAGKTVMLTDPETTRFFMTIREASALVIEASVLASEGETFVLDMGNPIKITDIIERYVRLTNSEMPEILVTGMRPGEKLHEELFDPSEVYSATAHPRISKVKVNEKTSVTEDRISELLSQISINVTPDYLKEKLVGFFGESVKI